MTPGTQFSTAQPRIASLPLAVRPCAVACRWLPVPASAVLAVRAVVAVVPVPFAVGTLQRLLPLAVGTAEPIGDSKLVRALAVCSIGPVGTVLPAVGTIGPGVTLGTLERLLPLAVRALVAVCDCQVVGALAVDVHWLHWSHWFRWNRWPVSAGVALERLLPLAVRTSESVCDREVVGALASRLHWPRWSQPYRRPR